MTDPTPHHEQRLAALATGRDAAQKALNIMGNVVSEVEDQVGSLDDALTHLITTNNSVVAAVGTGLATGAVINANTQIEAAIDAIHLALNVVNNAQVAVGNAVTQVDRTIEQVRAAPNN